MGGGEGGDVTMGFDYSCLLLGGEWGWGRVVVGLGGDPLGVNLR